MSQEVFYEKNRWYSKKSCNIQKKTPVLKSLLNNVACCKPCKFIKKGFQHTFSCEYREISKNIYFEEHLRTAASKVTLGSDCLELSF